MKWENLFRYAQDIWAPMAAPVVVVFLAGAFWRGASGRGANACLWLAILTVPFTLCKSILADADIHFLPIHLENPLVLAGAVWLAAWVLMLTLRQTWPWWLGSGLALPWCLAIMALAAASPVAIALLVGLVMVIAPGVPAVLRSTPIRGMWDWSMLSTEPKVPLYANLWLWWSVFAISLGCLYYYFW
jgi:hypothetical protein